MFINLVLDLVWSICHKDTSVCVARTHFRLRTLESGEEFGVDEGRFGVLELRSNIPCQSKVWILIDSAGN